MAGPNKAKKATKANRGMGKQAQRSATATSGSGTIGQLSTQTLQQSFRTATTTLLEETHQAMSNFKAAVQPLIGRARRANTGQAKTKTRATGSQAEQQGQRLAATG